MNIRINMGSYIYDCLLLLLGMFCTMPIVGVPIIGRYVSLYNIVFILFIIATIIKAFISNKQKIAIDCWAYIFLLFLLWPTVSYFIGYVYMPAQWHSIMTSYVLKAIVYFSLMVILLINSNKDEARLFSRGLIIGVLINTIWSVIETLSFSIFRVSINDRLFGKYFDLGRELLLPNSFGGIRACGLNYDPAHLGGLLPILLLYGLKKRNILIVIITIISLIFSQSTTAMVGCVFGVIVYGLSERVYRHNKVPTVHIVIGLSGILMFMFAVLLTLKTGYFYKTITSVTENLEGYISRISNVYVNTNDLGPRGVYYTKFYYGLIERGVILSLTGTGLGTSMYPFRFFLNLFPSGSQTSVTEVETNYIAYLFDIGIVGLITYISVLLIGIKRFFYIVNKASSEIVATVYFSLMLTILCSNALYHYIFTSYQILGISFAIVYVVCSEREQKRGQYGDIYSDT